MKPDDGGPAFPDVRQVEFLSSTSLSPESKHTIDRHLRGRSLRDYFAAAVLQGMCAGEGWGRLRDDYQFAASHAYQLADAMLAQRGSPA